MAKKKPADGNFGHYQCRHCQAWVNPKFGQDSPVEHQGAAGTHDDPRSPGDHRDCCDQCCYNDKCKKGRE